MIKIGRQLLPLSWSQKLYHEIEQISRMLDKSREDREIERLTKICSLLERMNYEVKKIRRQNANNNNKCRKENKPKKR